MFRFANLVDESQDPIGVLICIFHIMSNDEHLSVNFYSYSLPIFLL